jgi:hypothetical protein
VQERLIRYAHGYMPLSNQLTESSTCNLLQEAGQKSNLPKQQHRSYMPWQMQAQMLRRHYQMDVCHQLFPDY